MHNLSTTTLIVLGLVLTVVAAFLMAYRNTLEQQRVLSITTFEECAAAGYPVMESYPEQCRTPDGRLFVREVPPTEEPGDGLGLQANGCAVAGCSGQLCVSADEAGDVVTTCEYRSEYACYKEASCEPQADGKCGWTQTAELKQCLANPPALEAEAEVVF